MTMGESHPVIYKRTERVSQAGRERHGSWYFAVQIQGLSGQRERTRRGGYAGAGEAERAGLQMIAAKATGHLVMSAARGPARKVRRGRCGWMTQGMTQPCPWP